MAVMLENYGIDFFAEDEETLTGFVGYIAKYGKPVVGYYGDPYLFTPMGTVEFWTNTELESENKLNVKSFNAHSANRCVWEVMHTGVDITPKSASKLERVIMFTGFSKRAGMLPIEIITADVLPSLMKNDKVAVQVVALPLEINYYATEDEYADAQPADKNGKKWLVSNGSMIPISFLCNHDPKTYEKGTEYTSDRHILFTATVTELYHGTFEINDEKHHTFIRCFAETEFGKLEFAHTLEQVPEEQRPNIRVGSIISGTCIISGDVALREYENGIVKDFENDLKLLRYTLVEGDPERLGAVLSEDAVYESETTGKKFETPRNIINHISSVQKERDYKYICHYATITEIDDSSLEFPIGTKCLVLEDDENNYESIVFILVNDDGLITNIKISKDCRYHFRIEEPELPPSPLDDLIMPDSCVDAIVTRAKFHGMIDNDIELDFIRKSIGNYSTLEQNAKWMLEGLRECTETDTMTALRNVFGYLFAKSIEQTYNENYKDTSGNTKLAASYSINDAVAGVINSTLTANQHSALERAMRLGQQFYTDFKNYNENLYIEDDDFTEQFVLAAVIVQRLGQMYMEHCIEEK